MVRARKIASWMARRRRCRDPEALYGAALLGLAEALKRCVAMRPDEFHRYATVRMFGAVRDELRRQNHVSRNGREDLRAWERGEVSTLQRRSGKVTPIDAWRMQQAKSTFVEFDTVNDRHLAATGDSLEETLELRDAWRHVEATLSSMPARDAHVVLRYYQDEATLEEIGAELGLTESRASQLRKEAVCRLATMTTGLAKTSLERARPALPRRRHALLAGKRTPTPSTDS
jgi:RNA polymerase sigma factor for flagellar operon FliA